MRAALVDVLDRPLADQHVVPLVIDDHAHALSLEVEGDLVNLAAAPVHVQVGVGENRTVQKVLQTGLVVAVHVGVPEDVLALPARHIDVLLQNNTVLGERAGLVGAEDVDRTEVLDRVELLHDHLLARHGQSPLGEVHRHHHRKHLGGQAEGNSETEHEGSRPVMLRDADDQEDDANHHDHEAHHQPGEPRDAAVEAGEDRGAPELLRNRSEVGAQTRVDDNGLRRTADHIASLEDGVRHLDDCRRGLSGRLGVLLDRH